MADVEFVRGETVSGRGRPPVVYRLVTASETPTKEEERAPKPAPVVVQEPVPSRAPELTLSGSWL